MTRMSATLTHRGPDDEGFWRENEIGLAHRRLSILDVSAAGHQPMATPDGRWQLVFNGEIFNYRELAEQYLPDVSFTSTSDTEVLLQLLARYGEKTFGWLRGMYALALWDREKKELLLARDPFGKKPLYFSRAPAGLLFASEPKAILAAATEEAKATATGVTTYFSYEYVPAPATMWDTLEQVPMGTYQRWQSPTKNTSHRFWQPRFQPKASDSESRFIQKLDTLLQQSVRRRLVSDVPVGLLLSGGLDSSTIGWYMREETNAALHSFSVGFPERTFDEGEFAALAARHLKTEHHALQFTLDTFHETLAELVPLMDVPLGDASLLPTYAVSKLARKFCTVVLDGDGSDELFGGYGTFSAAVVAERLWWLNPAVPWLREILQFLPTHYTDFSLDFKLKAFARGLGLPLPQRNQVWLGSFTEREVAELLQPQWYVAGTIPEAYERWSTELRGLSTIDQVSLLTIYHYLQNDILVKLDRATMATSVEARTPFLDTDVADFAFQLPDRYKKNKYILKRLMASRLPSTIITRPKKGFGIPLGAWLRGPLYEWGREVLAEDKIRAEGIFKPAVIDRLWREHHRGRADHRKKLWTLLSFQLWHDFWVTGRSRNTPIPSAHRKAQ